MSLIVKAYLHHDWINEPIETRRFALDQDVATNYTYLTEKLAQIFPQVQAQNIIISYLDSDGDRVTVSSDEELTDALDQFDGTIFRIHLKKRHSDSDSASFPPPPFIPPFFYRQPRQPFCHPRFNGGCGQATNPSTTTGSATDPPPQATEGKQSDKGTPDEETPNAKDKQEQEKPQGPYHPGVVCDGCNGSIYGRRFKCTACPDYDLCGNCEKKGVHPDHSMHTINEPRRPCHGNRRWQNAGPWSGGNSGSGQQCGGNFAGLGPIAGLLELWANAGGFNPFLQGWGPGQQCNPAAQNTTKEDESMETNTAKYNEVLEQLKSMGFEDEGAGWLYELVKSKEGDLQKILDALHPATATAAAEKPTQE